MTKLLGSCLLIIAAVSMQFIQKLTQVNSLNAMSDLHELMRRLSMQIRLRRAPLTELLEDIQADESQEINTLLQNLRSQLHSENFTKEKWNQLVECLSVPDSCKKTISRLWDCFHADETEILNGLELAESQLAAEIKKREKTAKPEQQKFVAVTFSAAILLIILLV